MDEHTGGEFFEEWIELTLKKAGLEGMITYDGFTEKCYVVIPTHPDWENRPISLWEFQDNTD